MLSLAIFCGLSLLGDQSEGVAENSLYKLKAAGGVSSFLRPDGSPFWSFGVCCTETGAWKKYDPAKPAYDAHRLFPTQAEWVKDTQAKFKNWGFNSLGGWSDVDLFTKYGGPQRPAYFLVLHLGSYDLAPWHDLFAPQMEKAVEGAAKAQIPKVANDPYLVGYFTDNELGWWGDTLFKTYLTMPATSPGAQHVIALLKRHYANDFGALKQNWETPATTFDELQRDRKLSIKAGGDGQQVINEWMTELGTRYYSLMRDSVRRYDKRHLILGDRYCQFYNLEIAKASAPYVDVASTNLGAEWNDGSISHFFLDTLHEATKKPAIITEFYMCAMENRSGNKNSSGGFPIVQTQAQRAAAFNKYVSILASKPYVIGAHWFQFTDEPTIGRGDGENYNMGLVDINGRPYEELTSAAKSLDFAALRAYATTPRKRTEIKIPHAPSNPMGELKGWPRDAAFVPAASKLPLSDLYATWDSDNLYLATFTMDFMDESLYASGQVPEADRSTWTIRLEGHAPITIRFGGEKKKAVCDDPSVSVTEEPSLKHAVKVKIPMPKDFKRAMLQSELTTHGRGHKISWRMPLVVNR